MIYSQLIWSVVSVIHYVCHKRGLINSMEADYHAKTGYLVFYLSTSLSYL